MAGRGGWRHSGSLVRRRRGGGARLEHGGRGQGGRGQRGRGLGHGRQRRVLIVAGRIGGFGAAIAGRVWCRFGRGGIRGCVRDRRGRCRWKRGCPVVGRCWRRARCGRRHGRCRGEEPGEGGAAAVARRREWARGGNRGGSLRYGPRLGWAGKSGQEAAPIAYDRHPPARGGPRRDAGDGGGESVGEGAGDGGGARPTRQSVPGQTCPAARDARQKRRRGGPPAGICAVWPCFGGGTVPAMTLAMALAMAPQSTVDKSTPATPGGFTCHSSVP